MAEPDPLRTLDQASPLRRLSGAAVIHPLESVGKSSAIAEAVFVKISPPNTLTGIERYLGSGMVTGIGPV
jgi:hypothetical protein